MAQYIDKDALVAEIKKRFDEYSSSILRHYDPYKEAKAQELGKILTILDNLEVREVEVDLDTDFGVCWGEYCDCGGNINDYEVAKHFFELGLCSTITEEDCKLIWNISDEIPCMVEEDFFKELLKRYKAQKGKYL